MCYTVQSSVSVKRCPSYNLRSSNHHNSTFHDSMHMRNLPARPTSHWLHLTTWQNGQHSWLIFARSRVQMLGQKSVVLLHDLVVSSVLPCKFLDTNQVATTTYNILSSSWSLLVLQLDALRKWFPTFIHRRTTFPTTYKLWTTNLYVISQCHKPSLVSIQ
jgi:hypothetical protein